MDFKRRRTNPVTDFLSGFNGTYNTVNRVLQDMDMQDIATAKPETDTGYSQEQGDQLNAAAASGQYDIGYDQGKGAYTVTPKSGGETGTLSPVSRMSFLGKTYDKPLTDAQQDQARLVAMAGVHSKYGDPAEALRLKQQARQGELTDLQLKGAQRADRQADNEEKYQAGIPGLMAGSRFSSAQADGRKYSLADSLADNAAYLAYGTQFGKFDPEKWAGLAAQMDKLEKEGYHRALSLADAGGDLKKVAAEFNKTGDVRLDPSAVVSDKTATIKLRGNDVPTRIIQIKDANGNIHSINTASELAGLGEAKSLLDTHFAVQRDKRDGQRLGLEGARVGIAQGEAADRKTEKTEKKQEEQVKQQAAVDLYKQKNPAATSAELAAVRTGVINALPRDEEKTTVHMPTGMSPVAIINKGGKLFSADPSKLPQLQAPEAPKDPKARKIGETYSTPRGNLIWRGSGWEQAK